MPTYSYYCKACDTEQDVMRSVDTRDEPVVCTDCGYLCIRQIKAAPVHFKGSGFYKTGG